MIKGKTKYLIPTALCVLLSQAACFATDYYVDSSSGNDSNSGRSTSAPWRTLAKVNSYTGFAAGDRILLQRGRIWREQLIVPRSGASGSPIVFGAYGSGSNPLLKGSALVTNWTGAGSTNRWKASLGAAPNQVFFNGVRGTKKGGTSSLTAARDWYWASGVLYVYATSDPDGAYTGPGIEASVRPSTRTYGMIHIAARQYVTVQDIDVSQSASFGIYIRPTSRYITVRGCDAGHSLDGGIVASASSTPSTQILIENSSSHHNNGGFKEGAPGVTTYHEGLTMEGIDGFTIRGVQVYSNYMEGVNFKRGARNGIIENSLLYGNALINHYLEGATNIQIRYNKIYDCSYNAGIEFGLETNTYHNDNVRIYNNLFWNNAGGVSFWSANVTAQTRNINIYNNTFFNNWETIRFKSGATDNYSGTNYIRNNLIWQNSTSNWGIRDYTSGQQAISRTTIAYNVFQQGASTNTTGAYAKIISNPYFVNAGARDFHLTSSSPCIDAGTNLGVTRDFDGRAVPQGAGPDIGAYEYGSSSSTPTSYTLSVSATNGTVTKSPNKSSYSYGESVSLQATPNSGYTFTGWSGALTGTANPATILMDSNKSVTANFAASTSGGTTKTVGNTTVFSSIANSPNRRAVPYTVPEAGTLQSITMYHEGGSGNMILAVYSDSSGKPGSRLGMTNSTAVRSTAGWQTIALQSPVSASAGQKIWLAWVFQNTIGTRATSGTPGRADTWATWSGGMPTTFGSSTVGNYIYSIYATYATASSTPAGYTLSVSATNGTVTKSPNKSSYSSGESVSLQATPNSGYTFTGWSGALTGTANPATLVMNSNKSVTANFASSGSTSPSPGGTTKTVGTTTVFPDTTMATTRCAMPYTMPEAGKLQSISLYHQPGSGYLILAVYSDNGGKPGERIGVASRVTVTNTQGWQTVPLQWPVSVSAGQKIWLAWLFQNSVGIRATSGTPGRADSGRDWWGNMPTTFGSSTVANYIYSIYATYTTASSTPAGYTLSVSATNGTVTKSPNKSSYSAGESVSLQATPNSGYTFTGWSGALTGTANPATIVMDSNKSVTANFAASTSGGTTKTVGNTTVFANTTMATTRCAMPYTMPEAGKLQSVSLYHQPGSGYLILAVYSDNGGKPGERIGVASRVTVTNTQGWQTVPLQWPVSVSAGQKIWLAWLFQNSVGIRATSGTPGRADSGLDWWGNMPPTFGSSTVANYIYSIYATYTPTYGTAAISALGISATDDMLVETPTIGETTEEAETSKGKDSAKSPRDSGTPETTEPGTNGQDPTSGDGGVVLPDSPQTPSSMMLLRVGDAGKGVNPASVGIEVDGQLVYSGDVEAVSTASGTCVRAGTEADYTYIYQPNELSGEPIIVAVNARDRAGNVLPEQTYLFDPAASTGPVQSVPPVVDQNVDSDEVALDQSNLDQRRLAVATNSQGNTWSAWQAGEVGQRQIYVSHQTGGVETSDDTVQVTQGEGDHCNPALAVDGAGVLYVVWQESARGNWDVSTSVSVDGQTWSTPKMIVDTNTNQVNPAISASREANGIVVITWQDDRAGNQDVFMATSTDAFTTAEVTAVTSEDADQTDPVVIVDGKDGILLRWTDAGNGSTAAVETPQEQ